MLQVCVDCAWLITLKLCMNAVSQVVCVCVSGSATRKRVFDLRHQWCPLSRIPRCLRLSACHTLSSDWPAEHTNHSRERSEPSTTELISSSSSNSGQIMLENNLKNINNSQIILILIKKYIFLKMHIHTK